MNHTYCNRRCSQFFGALLAAALLAGDVLVLRSAEPPKANGQNAELFNGKDLTGWKVADKFWFDKHGKVEVSDGKIILEAGQPGTGIAFQGKLPHEDYELTFEACRLAGDDFFCGLTFPVGDSFCTLILGGWGGSVTGLSNIDDFAAVENETTGSVDFQKDRWYAVRLRVSKDRIQAWVDKEMLVDVARKDHRFSVWWEQEPMRPLGIATWNTKGEVRKIKLRRL